MHAANVMSTKRTIFSRFTEEYCVLVINSGIRLFFKESSFRLTPYNSSLNLYALLLINCIFSYLEEVFILVAFVQFKFKFIKLHND